jgi:surfeit locus 1 family protein
MRRIVLVLLFVFACAGLSHLGFWQLDRAKQKRARFAEYQQNIAAPALDLDTLSADSGLDEQRWRRAQMRGHYLDRHVILDNRSLDGQVGYEVMTLFATAAGRMVIVNRGWIPLNGSRTALPDVLAPADPLVLSGFLGGEPIVGIDFGDEALSAELLAPNLFRVQRVELAALARTFEIDLWPAILYLDATSAGALKVAWPVPGDGSSKHMAYAVQWFAMAAVLAALGIRGLKRRSRGEPGGEFV